MSEAKHTPGPWKMIEGKADLRQMSSIVLANDPDYQIAYVNTEWSHKAGREQDLANARLIAAAPDLLRIALKIMDSYDAGHLIYSWGTKGGNSQVEMLRSAIAAATGKVVNAWDD